MTSYLKRQYKLHHCERQAQASHHRRGCNNGKMSTPLSILQSCLNEPIHTPRHFKLNVRKADYKILQSQKARHYKLLYSQKADITKFCGLKKQTLQTFVVPKSGYHKILQSQTVDTTNFSNGWPRQMYVNKISKICIFAGFWPVLLSYG